MKFFPPFICVLFLALGVFTITSCGDDEEPEPEPCATYDADIKAIIDASCAYSGCHSGGTDFNPFIGNEGSRDYTSYAALKGNLDNGSFVQRVLVDKDMPNPQFVPAGMPTELTDAQLATLQCWADAGFPEN